MEKVLYYYEPNFSHLEIDNVWRGYENPFQFMNVFGYLREFEIPPHIQLPQLLPHIRSPYVVRSFNGFPNLFLCNFDYSQVEGIHIIKSQAEEDKLFEEIKKEESEC